METPGKPQWLRVRENPDFDELAERRDRRQSLLRERTSCRDSFLSTPWSALVHPKLRCSLYALPALRLGDTEGDSGVKPLGLVLPASGLARP